MITEVDRAKHRLFGPNGLGVKNISIFPGAKPGVSAEQVATELNKALDRIEAGDVTLINDSDTD